MGWHCHLTLAAALLVSQPAAGCNLALALAVDVSASISPTEYDLQMRGMADALDDPQIAQSLIAGRAALMVVQWSGAGRQQISLPWTRIDSPTHLADFTNAVRATPRAWKLYSTAIGDALRFTGAQFVEVPDCVRHVIDVSGDGLSNEGLAPGDIRQGVAALGITINGLAIENSIRDLSRYYGSEVIAGPGAFVHSAARYADYPSAIRQKLLTEIVKPAF